MSEHPAAWARVVGADLPETPWLLHPCDVWVRNPHYQGPPTRHPEDEDDSLDLADLPELPEQDQPWRSTAARLSSIWDTSPTWDDELPF